MDIIINDEIKKLVDRLFAMFYTCRFFNKVFADKEKLKQEKYQWSYMLAKNRITTLKQLSRAIDKFMEQSPKLPPTYREFMDWNNPSFEDLNIPTVDKAFTESCRNSKPYEINKCWSHDVVYHAWKQTGASKLNTLHHNEAYKVFSFNYEQACNKFINGESIDTIPKAIPENVDLPGSKEVAKRYLSDLKQALRR